ncbi:TPA: dTDP-4-amino-4,6-dideoxyglucose formyltransferase [Vibrio cholerae]
MKIFVITDNRWWLDKIHKLFSSRGYVFKCYCSPKGASIFAEEIKSGHIKVIDLKQQCDELLEYFDLGFSVHCKQIFPERLVNSIRCINIHPGLNPHNRGWFPQVFSIINKKPIGATIHIMDQQVDHGDILLQSEVVINEWDTSKAVYERVLDAEYSLLEENLTRVIDGTIKPKEMSCEGNYNSIADYAKIKEIDMDKEVTMREAIDYLRALTHFPYKNAYFYTNNGEKVFVSIDLEKDSQYL